MVKVCKVSGRFTELKSFAQNHGDPGTPRHDVNMEDAKGDVSNDDQVKNI